MRLSRLSKNDGVAMVFLAIILLVLLSVAALAVDLGRLYIAKQRAQNVADASALAGATVVPVNSGGEWVFNQTDAPVAVDECADENNTAYGHTGSINPEKAWAVVEPGTDTLGVTSSFPTTSRLRVDAEVPVEFGFAKIMGYRTARVPAHAIVELTTAPADKVDLPVPWTVTKQQMYNADGTPKIGPGDEQILKVVTWRDHDIGAGNFGAVAFPGDSGGKDYRDRIAGEGDPITITEPMWVDTQPGSDIGNTDKGLLDRLANDPWVPADGSEPTFENWTSTYDPETNTFADTTRVILVPVIDAQTGINGKEEVQVIGFAAFFLESYTYDAKTHVTTVTGRFMQALTIGDAVYYDPFGQFDPGQDGLVNTLKAKLIE